MRFESHLLHINPHQEGVLVADSKRACIRLLQERQGTWVVAEIDNERP